MQGPLNTSTSQNTEWLYLTDEAENEASQTNTKSFEDEILDLSFEPEPEPTEALPAFESKQAERVEEVEIHIDSKVEQFEQHKAEIKEAFDGYIDSLVNKIDEQAQLLSEKERLLEEKEIQLKLIPDLQKQLENKDESSKVTYFENQALKKQVDLLQNEKETTERVARITRSILSEVENESKLREQEITLAKQSNDEIENLKAQVERLKKPWWKRILGGI